MSQVVTDQLHYWAPPTTGGVVRVTASNVVQAVDLTSMAGWPGNQVSGGSGSGFPGNDVNPISHMLSVMCETQAVWIVFSNTLANAKTIDTTTISTVNATTGYINSNMSGQFTSNACLMVPAGQLASIYLTPGANPQTTPYGANSPTRFMGFVLQSANTSNLTFWQSSY